jgi:hypothetical protein
VSKHRERQQSRALARVDSRASAGTADQLHDDPVGVGPNRSITVDMARLPTPPNAYDADYAWIEHSAGDVRLMFAKRNRDEPEKLRTRLEIRYPPESLVGHFWRNSREFHQKMKAFASSWPQDDRRNQVRPETLPAGKEHSEWANFDSMAHAGTEALVDFYTMPVSGIAKYVGGQGSSGLKMIPVVRVQLTVFELTRLLDSMESVVSEIERYMPATAAMIYEPKRPVAEGEVV